MNKTLFITVTMALWLSACDSAAYAPPAAPVVAAAELGAGGGAVEAVGTPDYLDLRLTVEAGQSLLADAERRAQETAAVNTAIAVQTQSVLDRANTQTAAIATQVVVAQTQSAATSTANAAATWGAVTQQVVQLNLAQTAAAATNTQVAHNYNGTATANADNQHGTATAVAMTYTQAALTGIVSDDTTRRQADLDEAALWRDALRWGIIGIVAIAVALGAWTLMRWVDMRMLRQSVIKTPEGTVSIAYDSRGRPVAIPLFAQTVLPVPPGISHSTDLEPLPEPDAPEEPDGITVNGRGGPSFIPRREPDDPHRALALELLRISAVYCQAHPDWPANRLPGFRELDWNSDKWKRAKALLGNAVVAQQGRGTFTVSGCSIAILYADVGARRVKLAQMPEMAPA